MSSFVAIDFETANQRRDSACAIGLVKVVDNKIVDQQYRLINPQDSFSDINISIHGITPEDVEDEPSFDQVWQELEPMLDGVSFVAAHNMSFDKSVLRKTCERYNIKCPSIKEVCTVKLSRQLCPELTNHKLNTVCAYLDIKLDHHNALSDALACAEIVIFGIKECLI